MERKFLKRLQQHFSTEEIASKMGLQEKDVRKWIKGDSNYDVYEAAKRLIEESAFEHIVQTKKKLEESAPEYLVLQKELEKLSLESKKKEIQSSEEKKMEETRSKKDKEEEEELEEKAREKKGQEMIQEFQGLCQRYREEEEELKKDNMDKFVVYVGEERKIFGDKEEARAYGKEKMKATKLLAFLLKQIGAPPEKPVDILANTLLCPTSEGGADLRIRAPGTILDTVTSKKNPVKVLIDTGSTAKLVLQASALVGQDQFGEGMTVTDHIGSSTSQRFKVMFGLGNEQNPFEDPYEQVAIYMPNRPDVALIGMPYIGDFDVIIPKGQGAMFQKNP